MTAIEKIVSLAALGVIVLGTFKIRAVRAAEEFKRPEALQKIYAEVNRQGFDGKLPDVRLDWAVLKDASGVTYFDGKDFIILLDPDDNPTPEEALKTMKHEACHILTQEVTEPEHGPEFQKCKARLQKFGEVR